MAPDLQTKSGKVGIYQTRRESKISGVLARTPKQNPKKATVNLLRRVPLLILEARHTLQRSSPLHTSAQCMKIGTTVTIKRLRSS